MLKKLTAAAMAFTLLLSGGAGTLAATTAEKIPEGMKEAIQKHLEEDFYDYNKGEELELSKTIQVEATPPAEEGEEGEEAKASGPITVYASLATFQTVRDNIFTFEHREVVYYDATNDKVLTSTEAAKLENKNLMEYKDQFAHLGKKMNLGWILFLHSLILLVPAYFMFVWSKQVYSSTSFQIRNNLYNQNHTFN